MSGQSTSIYKKASISPSGASAGLFVLKAGDTMTGALTTTNLNLSAYTQQNAANSYYDIVIDASTGQIRRAPVISSLGDVLDNTLTTPPSSPSSGDRYIVAAGATGAWSGQATKIASWNGSSWDFYTPATNDKTTVTTGTNAGVTYVFNGSTWAVYTSLATTWQFGGNPLTSAQSLGSTTAFDVPFIVGGTEVARLISSGTSFRFSRPTSNTFTSIASTPSQSFTGTWFTGGSTTTTKPHFLIEPTGTTSTGWSANGTGAGVNAATGFTGNLLDLQLAGSFKFRVSSSGIVTLGYTGSVGLLSNAGNPIFYAGTNTGITSGNGDLMLSGRQGCGIGFQASTSGSTLLVGRFSNNGDFRIDSNGVTPLSAIATNNGGSVTNVLRNAATSGTTNTTVALSFQTDSTTQRASIAANRSSELIISTGSTEAINISSAQLVRIGTPPTLDTNARVQIYQGSAANTNKGLVINTNASGSVTGDAFQVNDSTNANSKFKISKDGNFFFNGSMDCVPNTQSGASYTNVATDFYVRMTNTGARTFTLFTAVGNSGHIIIIKDAAGTAGTSPITFNTTSSETIDGASSGVVTISANYGVLRLISNGTNWETF